MAEIALLTSTDNQRVDEILRGIVGLFETVFPDRVRGYYLLGSFMEGTARPVSDIDLCILFKNGFTDADEERTADRIVEHCARISPVELDVSPLSEAIPFPLRAVNVKLASRVIYGEDIRDRMPLPPMDAYMRHAMDLAFRLIARSRHPAEVLTFPLDYPDAEGEFYGYDRTEMRPVEGVSSFGIKDMIVSAGLIATAIIARKAGQYVAGKSDCAPLYRAHVNDAWAGFVEEITASGRNAWGYLVPDDPGERRRLRELCREMRAFENHFLTLYKEHLPAELQTDG
jgi:predicted nucleotidyltransferase